MLVKPPSNRGVPINPYPVDIYDHVFECVTINCGKTFPVEIPLMRVPNKVSVWDKTDWVWRCPKCDEVQIARADLPESIPLTEYAELRKQGGKNGTGKKRKRSPKKKEKGNDGSKNITE